jgi:hypothetical protein
MMMMMIIIVCWVTLQDNDVPANTKFSAMHIPHMNLSSALLMKFSS